MAGLSVWATCVVSVVTLSFLEVPAGVSNGREWWLTFAAPTAAASLIIGVPFAGLAWFLTVRTLLRRQRSQQELDGGSDHAGASQGRGRSPY
jgi:hypothetical protein